MGKQRNKARVMHNKADNNKTANNQQLRTYSKRNYWPGFAVGVCDHELYKVFKQETTVTTVEESLEFWNLPSGGGELP